MNRRRFVLFSVTAFSALAALPRALVLAKRNPTVAAKLPSGGLGLTGRQWKQLYGKPGNPPYSQYAAGYKEQGYTVALYYLGDTDQIQMFDLRLDNPLDPDVAATIIADFLPKDATQLDRYRADEISVVLAWHSDWLASTQVNSLDPTDTSGLWPNANPGDFITLLWSKQAGDPTVTMVLFNLGNNP